MNFLFVDKKNSIGLVPPSPASVLDHLPAKIYRIQPHEHGIDLTIVRDTFDLPEKIYGKKHAELLKVITNDYRSTSGSLGAMFIGDKGSGKSLLSEAIANKLLAQGVPVLLIDRNYNPLLIKDIVLSVGPCVVIFEEFSKLYSPISAENSTSPSDQSLLLTLFSDSSLKGILFLLTENNNLRIDPQIIERPGRIKYYIEFNSPGVEIFEELCEGFPIHPEVMAYLRLYTLTHEHNTFFGIDTLITVRDAAVNVLDVEEMIAKLNILNVPGALVENITIMAVYSKKTGKKRTYVDNTNVDGKDIGVTITCSSVPGLDTETFSFNRSDMVLMEKDEKLNGRHMNVTALYSIDLGDEYRAFINTALLSVKNPYGKSWYLNQTGYDVLSTNGAFISAEKELRAEAGYVEPEEVSVDRPQPRKINNSSMSGSFRGSIGDFPGVVQDFVDQSNPYIGTPVKNRDNSAVMAAGLAQNRYPRT